jgi:hypothetical protein
METDPPKRNTDHEKQVSDKVLEQQVENEAFVRIGDDEELRAKFLARKAVEQEVDSEARQRAIAYEEARMRAERRNREEHPELVIDYLARAKQEPQNFETIYSRLHAKSEEAKRVELRHDRHEGLMETAEEARKLTLGLAQEVADRLIAAGKTPDTQAFLQRTRKIKKWGTFASQNKLRGEVDKPYYEEVTEGWVLPVKGQIDDLATAVLCRDGRVLTAYGRFLKKGTPKGEPKVETYGVEPKGESMNRLDFLPNRVPEEDKPDDAAKKKRKKKGENPNKVTRTYSSFLNEDLGSDLGQANLPTNAPLVAANIVFRREQELQDAIVSLLTENNIPITGEPPTTETPPGA